MQKSTEQVSANNPVDREALVAGLERFVGDPEYVIEGMGPEGVAQLAAEALQLLGEYDGVLRGLACWLSAGGWNSDGLIDPDVADKKIRWGVNYLIQGAQAVPLVAETPSSD